jgi:hypothetical protein
MEAGGCRQVPAYLVPAAAGRQKRKVFPRTPSTFRSSLLPDIPIVQKLLPDFPSAVLERRGNYLPSQLSGHAGGDGTSPPPSIELRALQMAPESRRRWAISTSPRPMSGPGLQAHATRAPAAETAVPSGRPPPGRGSKYDRSQSHAVLHPSVRTGGSRVEGGGFFPQASSSSTKPTPLVRRQTVRPAPQSNGLADLRQLYNPRSQKACWRWPGDPDAVTACAKLHQIDAFFDGVREASLPGEQEFRVRRAGLVENTLNGALIDVVEHPQRHGTRKRLIMF